MRRLIMSAIAVSIAAVTVSAADEYDSYVWLCSPDKSTSSSFLNNDNERWQKKGSDGTLRLRRKVHTRGRNTMFPLREF